MLDASDLLKHDLKDAVSSLDNIVANQVMLIQVQKNVREKLKKIIFCLKKQ